MSTERDELAEAIAGYRIGEGYYAVDIGHSDAQAIADDIVAADYRKPRTVTTVEELAKLPDTAVIRDKFGDVNERRAGKWCGYEQAPLSDQRMGKYLPATVLDEATA